MSLDTERRSRAEGTGAERLRRVVEAVNRDGGTYHRMDFGDGLVLRGEYDMRKVLPHYGLPDDLGGRSVLDVGTATGFFAFECARRGAAVTAIDIRQDGLFEAIRDAIAPDVRFVRKSVYDLDPQFGRFDLVLCGSLLLHLGDLFGAIERIRSVCAGSAVVATSAPRQRWWSGRAECEFVGSRHEDNGSAYRVFWNATPAALSRMLLAAGFASAAQTGRFVLRSEPEGHGFAVPHVVVSARI